jgi:hypothetical protein
MKGFTFLTFHAVGMDIVGYMPKQKLGWTCIQPIGVNGPSNECSAQWQISHMGRRFGSFTDTEWNIIAGCVSFRTLPKLTRFGDCVYRHIKVAICATWGNTMRVHGRYWLDYDSVAFAVLMIALGIVELLVLDI